MDSAVPPSNPTQTQELLRYQARSETRTSLLRAPVRSASRTSDHRRLRDRVASTRSPSVVQVAESRRTSNAGHAQFENAGLECRSSLTLQEKSPVCASWLRHQSRESSPVIRLDQPPVHAEA